MLIAMPEDRLVKLAGDLIALMEKDKKAESRKTKAMLRKVKELEQELGEFEEEHDTLAQL